MTLVLGNGAPVTPAARNRLREEGGVLLVSCYDLGHPPLGLTLLAGRLERAGFRPRLLDLSVDAFDEAALARAGSVIVSVPMHTALRLGAAFARRARESAPGRPIYFIGLYAALNAGSLPAGLADGCFGPEEGDALVRVLQEAAGGAVPSLPEGDRRSRPPAPVRRGLPGLERYARLEHEGALRLSGYVEGTRGCKHRCTHCPLPPVYDGRFFVTPVEDVLAEAEEQVRQGAEHISFGDPDFLNGPAHALRLARGLAERLPGITFDFTAKVEHLARRRDLLSEFARCGCLFIVTAAESLNPCVLAILKKGHTRQDLLAVLDATRRAGIALRPTWVPFTPWSSRRDFREILEFAAEQDLVDRIDPVQYSIRLLVPPGSLLRRSPEMAPHLQGLDAEGFSYRWRHPDPEMDALQRRVVELVEEAARSGEEVRETFEGVRALAGLGPSRARRDGDTRRGRPPRLTESWFC